MPETVASATTDTESKSRRRWTIRFRRKPDSTIDWKRLFFLLLGRFRLGALIRFIPYPVIGGFLERAGEAPCESEEREH